MVKIHLGVTNCPCTGTTLSSSEKCLIKYLPLSTTGHYKMENLHPLKIVLAHTHFTKQFFTSLIFTSSILQKRKQWSSGGPEILPNDICIIVYLYISGNVWKTRIDVPFTKTLTTRILHVECYLCCPAKGGVFSTPFWGKTLDMILEI